MGHVQDFVSLSILLYEKLRLEIMLLLVREIRNLVSEKSGNFTFFDVWRPIYHFPYVKPLILFQSNPRISALADHDGQNRGS